MPVMAPLVGKLGMSDFLSSNYVVTPLEAAHHLKCPTWDVYSRLPLVHLVHVLDPRQLRPELLPARLAFPISGLGLLRLQIGKGEKSYGDWFGDILSDKIPSFRVI